MYVLGGKYMKIKLFGVLALVLLGTLVGCNNSVEDRHNLEENYRYDEYTHWKYCDDADCLMKDPYPKYLEGEHDLKKSKQKFVIFLVIMIEHMMFINVRFVIIKMKRLPVS